MKSTWRLIDVSNGQEMLCYLMLKIWSTRMNLFCRTNSIIQRKYTHSGKVTNLTSRIWMKLSVKENFVSYILIYTIWKTFVREQKTVTCQRTVSSGVDVLCILLKQLAFTCRYTDMVPTFGRHETTVPYLLSHARLYLHSTPSSFPIMEPTYLTTSNLTRFC